MGRSKVIRDYLRYAKAKRRVSKLQTLDSGEITKDFLLDSRLLEAQQLSMLLGLPEITEDDVKASEDRSRRVSHLLPLVTYFAASLSTGVMEYYDTISPWKNELSAEERLTMEVWVSRVSVSCALGILAQFEELDLIKVTR